MNGKVIWLTGLLWLLTSALAAAQPVARNAEQQARLYEEIEIMRRLLNRTLADVYDLAAHGHRNERWLGLTPHRVHLNSRTDYGLYRPDSPNMAHPGQNLQPSFDGAEGIYLKGQGVVYGMTMPVPPNWVIQPEPTPAAGKPRSDWEQMRQELRGEKASVTDKKRERNHPSLTDALLRVLVENGQHFSQLADNELLTLAITFRGQALCQSCHAATTGFGTASSSGLDSGMGGSMMPGGSAGMMRDSPRAMLPGGMGMPRGGMMPGGVGLMTPGVWPAGTSGMVGMPGLQTGGMGALDGYLTVRSSDASSVSNTTSTSTGTAQSEVSNYLLLADLHLKQGRTRDAVEAYQKAIQSNDEEFLRRIYVDLLGTPPAAEKVRSFTADTDPQKRVKVVNRLLGEPRADGKPRIDPRTIQNNLAGLELYTKLAQAYLALGDAAKAQQTLHQLHSFVQGAEWLTQVGGAPAKAQSTPTATKPPLALPAKLIISAPKRLLVQAAEGKISFDDLKKASVEYLAFAGGEKSAVPPRPSNVPPSAGSNPKQ